MIHHDGKKILDHFSDELEGHVVQRWQGLCDKVCRLEFFANGYQKNSVQVLNTVQQLKLHEHRKIKMAKLSLSLCFWSEKFVTWEIKSNNVQSIQ